VGYVAGYGWVSGWDRWVEEGGAAEAAAAAAAVAAELTTPNKGMLLLLLLLLTIHALANSHIQCKTYTYVKQ
jgi:hypothetical protein